MKEEKEFKEIKMHFFNSVNENLFHLFCCVNKRKYMDILSLLWDKCRRMPMYAVEKSTVIDEIENYIIELDENVELDNVDEEELSVSNDIRSLSTYFLRKLKSTGWIDEKDDDYEEESKIAIQYKVVPIIRAFEEVIMVDVENRAKEILTSQKLGAKGISTYVDYRTYLDYDIIVKNSVTGLEVPLSKVSGDGSDGENQAPFYVAICASLLQIYEQNSNCIRWILLDEVFNNMTSDRIEPMMKMFKNLNLQLVLIATPEKCTSIFPYCDITYSIVKQGSKNAIASFEGFEK